MGFTGKATFSAGTGLPEIVEDVSDIVSLVSPFETPLLQRLGDATQPATSTVHEWLEDELLPNHDQIDQPIFSDPLTDTRFGVDNADRFVVGDQVVPDGSREVMLVTVTDELLDEITVVRGYGGTNNEALSDDQVLRIIGNAALEGDDRPAPRFTNRVRRANYTQIFTASVEVSGSQQAVQTIGLADELDYQKQQRLREMVRDLENSVINGVSAQTNPQGSNTVRRTMRGILGSLLTHTFAPGTGPIPDGDGSNSDLLNEAMINAALRTIWENSSGQVDTIVVNGFQKRRVNSILLPGRRFTADEERVRELVSVYESDYGVARVLLSRWVPPDAALLLDSSRITVPPLSGRSFHYKPLASQGDSETGELIGEYTMEMRHEQAHGVIRGLGTTDG